MIHRLVALKAFLFLKSLKLQERRRILRGMAFIGFPSFDQVSPRVLRISGISLPPDTSGTIGLRDSGPLPPDPPDVVLPIGFWTIAAALCGSLVSLRAAVEVRISPESAGPLTNLQPSVVKTGETAGDFRITIKNTNTSLATQTLEIYIQVHDARSGRRLRRGGVSASPIVLLVGDALCEFDED